MLYICIYAKYICVSLVFFLTKSNSLSIASSIQNHTLTIKKHKSWWIMNHSCNLYTTPVLYNFDHMINSQNFGICYKTQTLVENWNGWCEDPIKQPIPSYSQKMIITDMWVVTQQNQPTHQLHIPNEKYVFWECARLNDLLVDPQFSLRSEAWFFFFTVNVIYLIREQECLCQ
jgi:hypothetical protein